MTCNVFGGTLNLTQLQHHYAIHCCVCVWFFSVSTCICIKLSRTDLCSLQLVRSPVVLRQSFIITQWISEDLYKDCDCVYVWLKSDSDSEAVNALDNKQQTDSDKEQPGAAVSTHTRRSTSRKVAQNERNSYQVNAGNRRDTSALTVVQDSAASSEEDSAVRRGKRQRTSRKWKTDFVWYQHDLCSVVCILFCF